MELYDDAMEDYLRKRVVFQKHFETMNPSKKIPLRPKNVWLLHGGRLSKEMGSLAHADTQFGEQKNAQMKQFGQRAGQTKNLLETLACREKNFMALNSIEKSSVGKTLSLVPLSKCSKEVQEAVNSSINFPQNFQFFRKFILFDSVFAGGFECGVFHSHPRRPKFALIATVAAHKSTGEVFFVCQESNTTVVKHLDLLEIEILNSFFLLKPSQIILGKPINIYKRENCLGQLKLFTASFF
jgi:hypothetical protein